MARFRGLLPRRGAQSCRSLGPENGRRRGITWRWLLAVMAVCLLATAPCGYGQEPATAPALPKAQAKIADALDSPTELKFVRTPLSDVAAFLAAHHGISVRLDSQALEDSAIEEELPITFEAKGIKLRNALKLMLEPHDLGVHYRDEVLVITTREVMGQTTFTRVYPIHDFLGDDPDGEGESWAEIVQSTVIPWEWDRQGGPGIIAANRGKLVVTQTDEVHEALSALLNAVRKYHQATQAARGKPLPTVFYLNAEGRTFEAWNALLDKELDLDLAGTPLVDVARLLSAKVGVPVLLDERALQDSAIPFDLPITYQERDVSLRAALARILWKHDLGWIVRSEVVLITTRDVADHEVVDRLYPVADLVRNRDGTLSAGRLDEELRSTVVPKSWDEQGGPGVSTPIPSKQALLITHTQAMHGEIEAWLIKLRAAAVQDRQ